MGKISKLIFSHKTKMEIEEQCQFKFAMVRIDIVKVTPVILVKYSLANLFQGHFEFKMAKKHEKIFFFVTFAKPKL
jgi:hypothetical protein